MIIALPSVHIEELPHLSPHVGVTLLVVTNM